MAAGIDPKVRPFHAATASFADGTDTPRHYLERCIAVIDSHEGTIGAFVATNLDGARAAADEATARWKAGNPLSPIDGMPIGVKDVMETRYASFTPGMSMEEAGTIIGRNDCTGGPVLDQDGELVGFLSERDCLRMAMESRYHNFHGGHVESFMRQKVYTVPSDMGLFDVVNHFIDQWFHAYPVVDNGQVVGVVTRKQY